MLRPGTYDLFAWEDVDEDLWEDPEFCRRYASQAARITIERGETKNVQVSIIAAEEMK